MSATSPLDLDSAVVIALGGNLPGRAATVQAGLEKALEALAQEGITILARSGWWRSKAWPDPDDPEFLNGVALAQTDLSPVETIAALHVVEEAFGRQRTAPNAPRPLDLDLIAYGRQVIPGPGLVVPHPRAHERLFVMGPLAQIAPAWRHPTLGRTAAEWAGEATVGADAFPLPV
jgi:2-amino-4-hydroxy-6-hydroxymethyldihydropteridine diphosphokinase